MKKGFRNYRKLNIVKNQEGMTMVEVLMGFTVLMVLLGMLSGIISFSSKMMNNSVDLRNAENAFQREVYKTTIPGEEALENMKVSASLSSENKEIQTQMELSIKTYRIYSSDLLEGKVSSEEKDSLNMYFYYFGMQPGGGNP